MLAGIKAKPIERTKTINIPFTLLDLSFSLLEAGKGELMKVKLKLGSPVADFKIASYINSLYANLAKPS